MSTKNALIIGTGGIGSALRDVLVARRPDWRVMTAARRPVRDDELHLDLTDPRSITRAAGEVGRAVDRLHLLIVSTGFLHDGGRGPEKRIENLDATRLAHGFAVNAIGPALVAQAFLPLLGHDERAVFAALSARVGSIGDNRLGGWYGYRASKAALNQLLRTFAIECGRRAKNLICVGLHPGTVDTSLSAPFQGNVREGQLFTPERSAGHLLDVVQGLTTADTGQVFAWDGKVVPW